MTKTGFLANGWFRGRRACGDASSARAAVAESTIQRFGDVCEIRRERAPLRLAGCFVGRAQDRGRMNRRRHDRGEIGVEQLAALFRDAEAGPEDRLRRRGAE